MSKREKGLGEHNYCRNPDGTGTIWCHTVDPLVRWEHCDPLPITVALPADNTEIDGIKTNLYTMATPIRGSNDDTCLYGKDSGCRAVNEKGLSFTDISETDASSLIDRQDELFQESLSCRYSAGVAAQKGSIMSECKEGVISYKHFTDKDCKNLNKVIYTAKVGQKHSGQLAPMIHKPGAFILCGTLASGAKTLILYMSAVLFNTLIVFA